MWPNPKNLILRPARVRTVFSLLWACLCLACMTPTSATFEIVMWLSGHITGLTSSLPIKIYSASTWKSSSGKLSIPSTLAPVSIVHLPPKFLPTPQGLYIPCSPLTNRTVSLENHLREGCFSWYLSPTNVLWNPPV